MTKTLKCGYKMADGRCNMPVIEDRFSYSGYSHEHAADWCHWASPMHYHNGDKIFKLCAICGKKGPDNEAHILFIGHKFCTVLLVEMTHV